MSVIKMTGNDELIHTEYTLEELEDKINHASSNFMKITYIATYISANRERSREQKHEPILINTRLIESIS